MCSARIIKKFLKRFLIALAILVLLLAGTVAFLLVRPTTFDLGWLREPVDRQLTTLLDREVAIDGDLVLVTGFSPSIRIEGISVDHPEGWEGDGTFARLDRFETKIGLPELFRKELDIDDITIEGFALSLQTDAGGRGNWEALVGAEEVEPAEAETDGGAEENEGTEGGFGFTFTALGSLEISDLVVTKQPFGGKIERILEIEQLTGSAPEGEEMQLSLAGHLKELSLTGELQAGTLAQLFAGAAEWPWAFDGRLGTASVKVESQIATVDFSTPGVTSFSLDIPDSRELESITGPIPHVGSIGVAGEIERKSPGLYSLPALSGNLGEGALNAALELDLNGKMPRATGEIELTSFDLEAMSVAETPGNEAADASPAGETKAQPAAAEEEAVASNSPAGSAEPREFVLPVVGSFQLKIGEIKNSETSVRDLTLSLEVEEQQATATVGVEFAGAEMAGKLTLEKPPGDPLDLALELEGNDAELDELIRLYAGTDAFSGKFEKLHYKITGSGPSAMDAWARRAVDLSVENAAMIYRANEKDWNLTVEKVDMKRKVGGDGEFVANGLLGETPWEVQLSSRQQRLGTGLGIESLTGKLADLAFELAPLKSGGQASGVPDGLRVSLKGERLDSLDSIYELNLPPLGPYALSGEIQKLDDGGFSLKKFVLELGESRLTGALQIEKNQAGHPVVDLALNADVIQLDDYRFDDWSSVGAGKGETSGSPKKAEAKDPDGSGSKTSPGTPPAKAPAGEDSLLSYEVLSRLDATIELTVGKLLAGEQSLGEAKARMSLLDGRFELKELSASPLGGSLSASVLFHPKSDGTLDWRAAIKAQRLDFGVLARSFNPETTNGGLINLDMAVEASGKPFGKLQLAAATGRLNFDFCPTELKAGILDLWATNVVVALLPKLDSKNESKINCIIARCELKDGVITPSSLGLDTSKIRVDCVGTIDLKQEVFDLKLTPVPKRPQLLTLEIPLSIVGSLTEPKIDMGKLPIARTAVRMSANAVLFPLKVVAGERLPEDGSDVCPCLKGYVPPDAKGEKPLPAVEEDKEEDKEEPKKRRGIFDRLKK